MSVCTQNSSSTYSVSHLFCCSSMILSSEPLVEAAGVCKTSPQFFLMKLSMHISLGKVENGKLLSQILEYSPLAQISLKATSASRWRITPVKGDPLMYSFKELLMAHAKNTTSM